MTTTAERNDQLAPENGDVGEACAIAELTVTGMHCASCVRRIERKLAQVPGVAEAEVNLAGESARVTFDPRRAAPEALVRAVVDAGYGAEVRRVETPRVEREF